MAACSSDDGDNGVVPALTRPQLLDPTSCKDCHPKHYAEWSASMHAYATKDPVFRAMNKRGQEETNHQMGPFCVNCHAPMAVREGVISDFSKLDEVPEQLQGVTCYFCHNAIDAGTNHFNGEGITLANDNTMRAAIIGAQFPSTHKVQYSANHDHNRIESSQLCGTCHDIVNQLNYPLERTFSEYSQTFFSNTTNGAFQSCQSCHMDLSTKQLAAQKSGYPGVGTKLRDVHEHLFPGVDLALTDFPGTEAMRSAVEDCKLPVSVQYLTVDPMLPTSRFTVRFETQAGHAQPSGASQDRRMWMEVVGTDDNGKVLYMGGQVADGAVEEPPGTKHPCMMRDYTFDKDGKESNMFWDAASRDEARSQPIPLPLKPLQGSHTRQCNFPAPGVNAIPNLELKLRMRPIGMDVLQDLVASGHLSPDIPAKMQTLTVWTRHAHYDPETNQYLVDDPTPPPDCTKYKCMLDPGSCTAETATMPSMNPAATIGVGATTAGAGAPITGTGISPSAAGAGAPIAGTGISPSAAGAGAPIAGIGATSAAGGSAGSGTAGVAGLAGSGTAGAP